MARRDVLERFVAQGRDFERTFLDDDWSRMEQHFAVDAVYETLGPGAERYAGRAEVLGACATRSPTSIVDATRARLSPRQGHSGKALKSKKEWACTFTLRGAPDLRIEASERAVYKGDLIELLQERLTPQSRRSLNTWIAAYGARLPAPGV